ncbi:MAG: DHH family phosphoesterase [Eubacteriales bacterium]|nr:DHH family phosphoesterase [Eubacteriales bacterium]
MLKSVVKKIKSKKVYIQMHNFPDPDAIASAYGLSYLLSCSNIESVICYEGDIYKTTAYKMAKIIGINMQKLSQLYERNELSSESEIILVDAQKGNANIINITGEEIICIDHHPVYEHMNYLYSDIRPDVGACSSIIAAYYFESGIDMPKPVATALLYGIKVDTANMTRGVSKLDLDMFYNLYLLADSEVIAKLDTGILDIEDLEAYARAISDLHRQEDICFSNIGENCPEALIASISDFMLELNDINLAVIYSIRKEGIRFSVRSNGTYHAGTITNEALHGIGNGGGHDNMAGGFVSISNVDNKKDLQRVQMKVEDRFVKQAQIQRNHRRKIIK